MDLVSLTNFLAPYGPHSYIFMWAMLILCGFGFPMPEDVILISGGILAARGVSNYAITNGACFLGVLMGDGAVFLLGRFFGPRIKKTWPFSRIFKEKLDNKVSSVFNRYGNKVIFMGRFMPGLRMPIFLTSGIYQVPIWTFFLLDGAAASISVPLWIYAGRIFGENLELLEHRIKQLKLGMVLIAGAFIALILSYMFVKRQLLKRSSM